MSDNFKYLVSAIVSTYKSERFIRGKIEDLLKQTIADSLEIIIVNSGSPQNEDAIIKEYLPKHPNIKYIHTEERETIYKAWNRGIRAATGKYITNSNTDDRLKHDALEILTRKLEEDPEIALLYADQYESKIENEEYERTVNNNIIQFPDYSIVKLLDKCIIGSQPIWRASLNHEDNIWFDESYEVCGDHDFELTVAHKYKIYHLAKPIGTFYKSPARTNKEYENINRNIKELNRLRTQHINYYLSYVVPEKLEQDIKDLKKYLWIPFLVYALMAKSMDIIYKKRYYRPHLIYSVDFIACFCREAFNKLGLKADAGRIEKRYIKYLKIKNIIITLRDSIKK